MQIFSRYRWPIRSEQPLTKDSKTRHNQGTTAYMRYSCTKCTILINHGCQRSAENHLVYSDHIRAENHLDFSDHLRVENLLDYSDHLRIENHLDYSDHLGAEKSS